MKGYVPYEIPVKRYVKAYIEHHLQVPLVMNRKCRHSIIEKLYDYMEKDAPPPSDCTLKDYPCFIKVHITVDQFNRRGATITNTNIKNFNNFCETFIKEKFRILLDDAWAVLPGFDCHLPDIRQALGIGIEDWSDDSMKKDYYRYRLRTGKPVLRKGQIHVGRRVNAIHAPF